jgi:hypothetical protein
MVIGHGQLPEEQESSVPPQGVSGSGATKAACPAGARRSGIPARSAELEPEISAYVANMASNTASACWATGQMCRCAQAMDVSCLRPTKRTAAQPDRGDGERSPVVGTDIEGIRGVISLGQRLPVVPDDFRPASALSRLIDDAALSQRMAAAPGARERSTLARSVDDSRLFLFPYSRPVRAKLGPRSGELKTATFHAHSERRPRLHQQPLILRRPCRLLRD